MKQPLFAVGGVKVQVCFNISQVVPHYRCAAASCLPFSNFTGISPTRVPVAFLNALTKALTSLGHAFTSGRREFTVSLSFFLHTFPPRSVE